MPTESHPTDEPAEERAHWEAIARHLAGESSSVERAGMERWLAARPREAAAMTTLDAALAGLRRDAAVEVRVDDAWRRLESQLDEPVVLQLPARAARPIWRPAAIRVAAAAALIAGPLVWRWVQPRDAPVAAREFATRPGVRDSVVLADGSHVLLGPGSALRAGGRDGRDVRLQGEALFVVRHDAARPFVVRAADAEIRDLGTTFAVRAAEGAAGTTVAVTAGLVRLTGTAAGDTGVVLRAGDEGAVGADGRASARRGAPVGDAIAWTRGRLVFRDTPLPAVAASLHRWYGVDVRVDSALAGRTLTASFDGEPIADVLRVIGLALDVRVERTGDLVVLAPATAGRPR